MSGSALPHLVCRGRVFYFRRAIPKRLTARFGRREIMLSLRTSDQAVARRRCRILANVFESLVQGVDRVPGLTPEQIDGLVRAYFRREWEKVNETAWQVADDPVLDAATESAGARQVVSELRQHLIAQEIDPATRRDVREVLAESGVENLSPVSDEYHQLALGLLRARLEASRLLAATLDGQTGELAPQDPLFQGIVVTGMPDLGERSGKASHTLGALIGAYCDMKAGVSWTQQSALEYRRALDMFAEFVGSKRPITSVQTKDIREFRDILAKLPKSFRTNPKYKGKPLVGIPDLAEEGEPGWALQTQKKYFSGVKAFFDWAEREDQIPVSPVRKIGVEGKATTSGGDRRFSEEALKALFTSPQWTGHFSKGRRSRPGDTLVRDGKFWIPLVALYGGMRLGEIVQLLASDVREENGVPYIDINKGEGTKSLKTTSAVRQVPVHPRLVEVGFLEYVEARRKVEPTGRLFPDVTLATGGQPSKAFSKWFSRYLRDIGLKRPELTFHGFRHTFIRAIRDAKVPDSRIKAIVGCCSAWNIDPLLGVIGVQN